MYRLRLVDGISGMGELAEFVEFLSRKGGLTQRQAYRFRLAADEITTNVASYGYGDRGGVVDVDGGVDEDWVWLRIEDDAPPFDPREHDHAPRLAAGPNGGREGGYGLFLALGGLDHFAYDYVGGRNRSTLYVRRLPPPAVVGSEFGGLNVQHDCARGNGVDRSNA